MDKETTSIFVGDAATFLSERGWDQLSLILVRDVRREEIDFASSLPSILLVEWMMGWQKVCEEK